MPRMKLFQFSWGRHTRIERIQKYDEKETYFEESNMDTFFFALEAIDS